MPTDGDLDGAASQHGPSDAEDGTARNDSPGDSRAPSEDGEAAVMSDDAPSDSSFEHDSRVGEESAAAATSDASAPEADGSSTCADGDTEVCDDAGAKQHRSCDGLPPICGPAANDDCCASSVVPGGAFNRDNDATYPATISDFRLDTYEITVGRFRKFLTAFRLGWRPATGSGKNPNDPLDRGWDAGSRTGLISLSSKDGPFCDSGLTWTPGPVDVAGEARPENCIGWEVASAFCIWDGGRLPTDAEWNYAAAGGGDSNGQRWYPWSDPPTSVDIDTTFANYNDGAHNCSSVASCLAVVGATPKGNGRWGQSDLAGNVSEWVLDGQLPYPATCVDCSLPGGSRVARGGSFFQDETAVRSTARYFPSANGGRNFIGARCARSP